MRNANRNQSHGGLSIPKLALSPEERDVAVRVLAEQCEDWRHVVADDPGWSGARERLVRLDACRIGAEMGLLAVLPADGTWASVVHMLGDAFSDVVADDPRAPDAVVLADLFARASRTG